jgi:NAD(P)-dependent dehydrogenase (short-subunit alcohol dehydrogenase family)
VDFAKALANQGANLALVARREEKLKEAKALATEWSKDGITVNAIEPGYFALGMAEGIVADPEFSKVIGSMSPMGRAGRSGELVQQFFTLHPMHQHLLRVK